LPHRNEILPIARDDFLHAHAHVMTCTVPASHRGHTTVTRCTIHGGDDKKTAGICM
jgi:hypothetical protein